MKKIKKINIPILFASISFLIMIGIILQYTEFTKEKNEKEVREILLEIMINKKAGLEKALYSRIYYTKGIAAYIAVNGGITAEKFYQLADELIQNDTVISTMALSPDCIIKALYPLEGHEAAIGVNLLAHPARKKIVEETIISHKTFVAGPVELVEGGLAFISYTPIFIKNEVDTAKFWGVCDIVIYKDKLLNEARLTEYYGDFKFCLRGIDGEGDKGEFFWGDSTVYNKNPVNINIVLPTGNWVLSGVPILGWEKYNSKNKALLILLYFSALVISVLIWFLTKAIIKIKNNERELSALFTSLNEIVIIFDDKGIYKQIAPSCRNLLVKPYDEIINKSLFEIFDEDTALFFYNAITKSIKEKTTEIIEYDLEIDGKTLWFEAKITYITNNLCIYAAHDITNKKLAENRLKKSEEYLTELNKTKDRFFSIIAHDLRSPFQGFLGLSDLLATQIDKMDITEAKVMASELNENLNKQFLLLDDLLNWAKLQSQKYQLTLKPIKLFNMVESVFSLYKLHLTNKNIVYKNDISPDLEINADYNMILLVLRNLINNSIKFTKSGGVIIVSSKQIENKIIVSVFDSGVGIEEEKLSKLFSEVNLSSVGTNTETGTGLGLILCKDIIDKHNGKIWVESHVGIGTTFMFLLPL
ncbi:MAG TPA: ATP-binding protein [Melioribacteraceae bacterium]|nr:ATP-binding protein [Melioribacteraceae bacterium]